MSPRLLRLGVLTTGRQDYGIMRSTLRAMRNDSRFTPILWVGGMHLSSAHGETIDFIEADGQRVDRLVHFASDSPSASAAKALMTMRDAFAEQPIDALLVVGDRSETLAAGVAACIERVPLVHIHGGEETRGAIDNACRHALTKLAHLHLVSHERHAVRVRQMGEDPSSVVVVGAPGIDNLYRGDLPDGDALVRELGGDPALPLVIVTMHPATLGDDPEREVAAVADAMALVDAQYIVTAPNTDAGGDRIRQYWHDWAYGRARVILVDALGEARYWALLQRASAVLGNSSSGIIEAPAARVPAINVGDRQSGRFRYGTVFDVSAIPSLIERALRDAVDPNRPREAANGYPEGPAAPRIIEALAAWVPPVPPRKSFVDLECVR